MNDGDEMDVDYEVAAGAVEVVTRINGRGALAWRSSSARRTGQKQGVKSAVRR
jgi:hypothetical protein